MASSSRIRVLVGVLLLFVLSAHAAILCPDICRCTTSTSNPREVITDCSRRGLSRWPGPFDPRLITLNLSGNQLSDIPRNALRQYENLSHIDLSDNQLNRVAKRTFIGLKKVKTINLARNMIGKVERYAFSELAGAEVCKQEGAHCMLDLRFNDLTRIEEYAFNMLQGLEIMIGNSRKALTVESYAFYGARNLKEIAITSIHPQLNLESRVFTNTEKITKITVSDARLGPIQKFAFEGLKGVSEIEFYDCEFVQIDPYGFSGIFYAPTTEIVVVDGGAGGAGYQIDSGNRLQSPTFGGTLNITSCIIDKLPADLFRDTNLARVNLQNNLIGTLDSYIFRGMTRPQNITLSGNSLRDIKSRSLGSLSGVRHLSIIDNHMDTLPDAVFYGNKEIEKFTLQVRESSNLTLSPRAFDGVFDVNKLEIRGDGHSHLDMPAEAFGGMFGVADMQFIKIKIPRLTTEAFKGLRKVDKISFISCNVAHLIAEPTQTYDSMAGINSIDLSTGNFLVCDCSTTRVLRELDSFLKYEVNCETADGSFMRVSQDLPPPECLDTSGSTRLHHQVHVLLLPAILLFLLWLR